MLEFLVNNDALSEGPRSRILGWRHSGCSAHNEVRVPAEDAEARKKLAGTMLRAPMSLEKMTYDAATGTVNLALEEASRVEAELPGDAGCAVAGAAVQAHSRSRDEHLVRYVGGYSKAPSSLPVPRLRGRG